MGLRILLHSLQCKLLQVSVIQVSASSEKIQIPFSTYLSKLGTSFGGVSLPLRVVECREYGGGECGNRVAHPKLENPSLKGIELE